MNPNSIVALLSAVSLWTAAAPPPLPTNPREPAGPDALWEFDTKG